MKTRILIGLSIVLTAGCVFVQADDTPAQAAARAALEQEFHQLDHAPAQPSPQTNAVVADTGSAESADKTVSTPASTVPAESPTPTDAGKVSVAPSVAAPPAAVPPDNTAAQTAALAALKQKMEELNAVTNQPAPNPKSGEMSVQTPAVAPALNSSVAATPITEAPAGEAPAAKTPAIATAAITPASVAPAVTVPASEVSSAPAVAATPAANIASDAVPGSIKVATAIPVAAPPATIGLPKSLPGQARPTNELVTTGGKTYKNVELERVALDGIFISYTPAQGGWATTKVAFEDLPAELRQIYENK